MERIKLPENLKASIENRKTKGNVSPLHEFILQARKELNETSTTGDGSFGFYLGMLKTIPNSILWGMLSESKLSKEPNKVFWWKVGQYKKLLREANAPFKIGEQVRIIKGPLNKVGLVGTVETIMSNGCIVKLSDNLFTPVQFKHLEKV